MRRPAGRLGLAMRLAPVAVVAGLWGCGQTGGPAPWRRPASDDAYTVMRPRFNERGRRNFYVSGYAGDPFVPRRDRVVTQPVPVAPVNPPAATLGQPETFNEDDARTVPEL